MTTNRKPKQTPSAALARSKMIITRGKAKKEEQVKAKRLVKAGTKKAKNEKMSIDKNEGKSEEVSKTTYVDALGRKATARVLFPSENGANGNPNNHKVNEMESKKTMTKTTNNKRTANEEEEKQPKNAQRNDSLPALADLKIEEGSKKKHKTGTNETMDVSYEEKEDHSGSLKPEEGVHKNTNKAQEKGKSDDNKKNKNELTEMEKMATSKPQSLLMEIGSKYKAWAEEYCYIEAYFESIKNLDDDEVEQKESYENKIAASLHGIEQHVPKMAEATAAYDFMGPYATMMSKEEKDVKYNLFYSDYDPALTCGGISTTQPARICIDPNTCSTASHKKRNYGLIIPDSLYVRMTNQYAYPIPVCSKFQMSKEVFEALMLTPLSINEANDIRNFLFTASVETADNFITEKFLQSNEREEEVTGISKPSNQEKENKISSEEKKQDKLKKKQKKKKNLTSSNT